MKRNKRIHTGICISKERITAVTAHIENKTMVITDAFEVKRRGTIDEDLIRCMSIFSCEEGRCSIVSSIKTQMKLTDYDPHDFDVQEFIKWNVEDYFDFGETGFQLDVCRREYPRHHFYVFMVALDRHELALLHQGIRDSYACVDAIDFRPIPATYILQKRCGTVTGIAEAEGLHLWAWWKDTCVKEAVVPFSGPDISRALIEMEEALQQFGIVELQGVRLYCTEHLDEEVRLDIQALLEVYGQQEYIPMLFIGRGRTRCMPGELDWDMALGMAARGLDWIGLDW